MPAPARAVRSTPRLGRYELVRRLARGELTDLWLASGRVLVKQLRADRATDTELAGRFVTEARIAAELRHPNIAAIYDVGETYLATEYIHGESLRHVLARLHERKAQMPLHHALAIVGAAAAALHHAHDVRGADKLPAGVVHRAVTPGNILIGYDGGVKVVDFGIAKAALRDAGRVPYLPPEECTGQYVDRRGDIYALGVVLHEVVTGRRLFRADTEFLTMSAIAHGIVPRASHYRKDLPGALEAVITKALARLPADRFQTADELRLALEPIATKLGATTGLAAYMKELFGGRGEPWIDAGELATVPLDFDGKAAGLAVPPADAIEAFALPAGTAKDAPLTLARARAMPAPAVALLPLKAPPMNKDDITKVDVKPPEPAVATPVEREPTQVVSPLPVEGEIRNAAKIGNRGRYLWLAGTAIVATAAVVYFLSASAEPALPAAKPVELAIKPAPPKTPPPKEELATIPWEQRTAANSTETAPPPAAPAAAATPEPVAVATAKPEPAVSPPPAPDLASLPDDVPSAPAKPAPVKVAAAKPAPKAEVAVAKPAPAVAAKSAPHITKAVHHKAPAPKPAAPAAKPKNWDPDALFFEKK